MEQQVTNIIGTKVVDGKPINIVRHHFLNDEPEDSMAIAHSYFTKEERKAAKAQYKANR